jgi:LuxR family maltose regulon positive regulatory protein
VTASSFRLRPPNAPPILLKRQRITDRILSVPPANVVVVSAAPGYGATTALSEATRTSGDVLFWIGVDSSMSDEACRELWARAFESSVSQGVDGVLERLEHSPPAWLVIDGVSVHWQPGFSRDLLALAEHLPANARMAISSPHWFGPMPRALRLSEEDLAFTDDEAMELLLRRQSAIDIDTADDVIGMCEGWASALVAAATQRTSDRATDYLLNAGAVSLFASWFAALPDPQRQFLCATRVLRSFCGASALAVSGMDQASEMLLTLDTSHAYLTETDPAIANSGRWWRRHRLLTAYLDQLCDGEDLESHSRAADWYMTTGDVESVMHHLLAAGRIKEAGTYLTDHESTLLSRGGHADKVLAWYDRMTDAAEDRFVHQLRIGWGQALNHDIAGADATIAQIGNEISEQRALLDRHAAGDRDLSWPDPSQPGSVRSAWAAEAALLKAFVATFHADPATMVAGARRLLIEPEAHLNSDSIQLAPILVARGLLWSGQAQSAAKVLESSAGRPVFNDVLRETHLGLAQGYCDVANGYVRRAKTRVDATLRWMNRNGLPHDVLQFGPSLALLAEVTLELGDLDSAMILANQALEDAQRCDVLGEVAWAHLVIAKCQLIAGDYGAALRCLGESRSAATRDVTDSAMVVVIDTVRAEVHLATGDMVRAVRIIRSLPPSETRSLLWARAGAARQPAVARRTLETIQSSIPRTESQRHLLLAAVQMKVSRRMAQGHLRKAAAIAHKHGMGQLLHLADPNVHTLAESTALEFQDDNLFWLLKLRVTPRVQPAPAGPETPLSRGELELLSLLPSRSKNAEIAEGLGVSINTVKTRLRRLYAKLAANSRDEAIDAARRRGLLQ